MLKYLWTWRSYVQASRLCGQQIDEQRHNLIAGLKSIYVLASKGSEWQSFIIPGIQFEAKKTQLGVLFPRSGKEISGKVSGFNKSKPKEQLQVRNSDRTMTEKHPSSIAHFSKKTQSQVAQDQKYKQETKSTAVFFFCLFFWAVTHFGDLKAKCQGHRVLTLVWADENAASSKEGGGGRQCRAADKILKGRCGCSNGLINSRKFPLNPVCWGSKWRSVRPRVAHLLQVLWNSK